MKRNYKGSAIFVLAMGYDFVNTNKNMDEVKLRISLLSLFFRLVSSNQIIYCKGAITLLSIGKVGICKSM